MKQEKIFRLDPETSPIGFKSKMMRHVVECAAGLHKLDKIIIDGRKVPEGPCFSDRVLMGMNVEVSVSDEDRKKIPTEGAVIVVANHPFGGLEGVVLMSLLDSVRPDYKVMANFFLCMIPELRDRFIPVDPFGTDSAVKKNVKPLLDTMRWLKAGHILGVFPSGEVSSVDLKSGRVRDPVWSESVAALARKSGATVVPLFFSGHNPAYFQLAGLVHPRLRTVMLPSMMARQRHSTIEVSIGAPIPPSEMSKYKTDRELIDYFRVRAYSLEGRKNVKRRFANPLRRKRTAASVMKEPVISETPREDIEAEINSLPPEAFLFSGGDLNVYLCTLEPESAIMRELGRLREITFRGAGEGTGRATDIDIFDQHYLHLFLWNTKKNEIVGAYRLGLADEIQKKFGVSGLYSHTLFKFDDRLLSKFQPAIELGRSFVRPEYQRAFAPLLFLWKGIGTFIARNPRYTKLFGPVSITADYMDSSRNLLLRSLMLSNFSNELARFVKPRRPLGASRRKDEWRNPAFNSIVSNVDDVSTIIQDIEKDHKGIPILLRQYLKLGGKILAFNLDTDFSDVVDGLILIDVRSMDSRVRARYMGEEADAAFRNYHGLD